MTETKKTKSFTSDMTGAAVLSGTAGALIAVLDSVLVNGFGSVALTGLGVASGVASGAVASGHSFKVGSVATVTGATPSSVVAWAKRSSVCSLNRPKAYLKCSKKLKRPDCSVLLQKPGSGRVFVLGCVV